jgi:membrane protein DedA with SNARE-associated domain
MVLAPATLIVVVVAVAVGVVQTNSVRPIILMIAAATLGIQIGYFVGTLIRHGLSALLARRSSALEQAQRAAHRRAAVAD